MALAITSKENLKQIFDKVSKVYYFTSTGDLSAQTQAIELPVLDGGVTFNTGDPDINVVKLTDGTDWTTNVSKGDSDISFQVSSVHATIKDLLMEKKTSATISSFTFDGMSYSGDGYSLAPKKVAGALLMLSEDKKDGVYLPNVEIYASFNGEGGDDSTGYFNVMARPLADTNGAAFYPLIGTVAQ